MAKFPDTMAYVVLRKFFGECKNRVISFFNALLPLESGNRVESLEYPPSELVPETPLGKDAIVDVQDEETRGSKFIVVMHMEWRADFKQHMLPNASEACVKQMPWGTEYNFYSRQVLKKGKS